MFHGLFLSFKIGTNLFNDVKSGYTISHQLRLFKRSHLQKPGRLLSGQRLTLILHEDYETAALGAVYVCQDGGLIDEAVRITLALYNE